LLEELSFKLFWQLTNNSAGDKILNRNFFICFYLL